MFDVETPALLLYRDVMERNLKHMADRARRLGVSLRPHIKTHKCLELGRRQVAYGAHGIPGGRGAERRRMFDGIISHSGRAYRTRSTDEAAQIAEQERQVMVWFAELLRKDALPVRGVSVGSTPAMAAVKSLTGVTEARPGNYIFYDRTMVLIGCCEPQDVAVSVLATVVSHQPGASHFVVDAGALSLSKDLGPTHVGLEPAFGAVKDHPELTVASVSQEHGLIRAAASAAIEGKFKVGQQIEIIPNHSCLTEAHFDEYVVIEGGRVMDRWHIERGR